MKAVMSLALIGSLLLTGTAVAQDGDEIEGAIEYRQAALSTLGWNFGPLGAMAKGDMDYDAEEAAMRADRVKQLSVMPWEGFVEGSLQGNGHGVETDALAKIGDDWQGFEDKQRKMQEEAAKLAEVAANGDFAALREQVAATGKSCKNCHDDYREEE